ncbi:methyl-accepting chemotaxis protein [Thiomicrorhabdus xiamenensis]|uniref:HAMP domain-containing protein n=1 Tax=Thiomicrorhabdus xiamenensis TaxID=2739063 RepID=A0A7D4ST10_9GAMM|nr:methyl-accepting chemotaxis protein [Thiomicrorhabdus xiamenensis]QKI90083.1 HAMP domain-containing protein [Thiomicrorhabdus xiamenensis]
MKLLPKLIISFLLIGLIPLFIFASLAIHKADQGLHTLAVQQLESVRDNKKASVQRYFETVRREVLTLADTQVILQAMFYLPPQVKSYQALSDTLSDNDKQAIREKLSAKLASEADSDAAKTWLRKAVTQLDDIALLMQSDYIAGNENPKDQRWKLLKGTSKSAYHAIHASMQPVVHKFITNSHFNDLYLLDKDSARVLYSVSKQGDFGIDLQQPNWQGSALAQAWQKARNLTEGQTAFIDFSQYAPAGKTPVAFMVAPVVFEGKKIGLLAVEFTYEELNAIMSDRSGMGSSGDSFIIGSDGLMRTDASLDPKHSVLYAFTHRNETGAHHTFKTALQGDSGVQTGSSFQGTEVISAYTPLKIEETEWVLVTEMSQEEAFASSEALQKSTWWMVIVGLLLISTAAYLIARSISRPVQDLVETMKNIQQSGDFSQRHPVSGKDEIAEAAQALNHLMQSLDMAFKEIRLVMHSISQGQFNLRVNSDLHGDLSDLKEDINLSAQSVETTMQALSEVMLGIAEGDFSVRLDQNVKGELKQQVDNAMQQMDVAVNTISEAMEFAAKGEFSHRVTGDLKGDMVKLKHSVNASLEEIEKAIDEITLSAKAMSEGDLTRLVEGKYDGELLELQTALNHSIDHLSEMVATIRNASDEVTRGADQISHGSMDLNERTQNQAAALEQTASSMEQMTSSVRSNSDSAQQAYQLAEKAQDKTQQGVLIMNQTIEAMHGIESASEQISNIIGLIDSISFQTNLLALNAAVEAARAGEAGRGFAVVAGEVRNLAGNSADAANQIKQLIDNTVEQIHKGTELAGQSSEALQEIRSAIHEVNELIARINQSSSEQATGITQVNQAISNIDQTTQQNAHLVESLSEFSGDVDRQSKALQQTVSGFAINLNRRLPNKS